jgi:branched-chain amino acid aminotransferase
MQSTLLPSPFVIFKAAFLLSSMALLSRKILAHLKVRPGQRRLIATTFSRYHSLAYKSWGSNDSSTLYSNDLEITPANPSILKQKPPVEDLVFGKYYTDHMLRIRWTQTEGWGAPRITPLEDFSMHPAAKVLHYAQELFEGMKAYRGEDDVIRMFRPMHNMSRMVTTARRSCLPTFDGGQLVECIRRLIQMDQEWVPHSSASSLYIRPTLIGIDPTLGISPSTVAELFVILSPTGPYFATGVKPVNLMADPNYVRAWPGGCGFAKMGSNYAPTMWISVS